MKNSNGTILIDSLNNQENWIMDVIKISDTFTKTKGEGVKIATIDTGVDINNSDYKNKIINHFNFIDRNYDINDEYGHGSHVAGLLVGEHTGIAPNAELIVIKALDENGKGAIVDVMDGITFAMQCDVDIINISLGTPRDLPLILKQRIVQAYEKGITIVCATGNNGYDKPHYPARMDEVIGVGGFDQNLNLTAFTNMGYDILAPSVNVLSTHLDGKYAMMTGTSMASPIVAGAVALLISHYRKKNIILTPSEIKSMLSEKLDLTELIK